MVLDCSERVEGIHCLHIVYGFEEASKREVLLDAFGAFYVLPRHKPIIYKGTILC